MGREPVRNPLPEGSVKSPSELVAWLAATAPQAEHDPFAIALGVQSWNFLAGQQSLQKAFFFAAAGGDEYSQVHHAGTLQILPDFC